MRSKFRRKIIFIVFSALIMVGLCIGVFADYNDYGTYSSEPFYYTGDLIKDFSTDNDSINIDPGHYVLRIDYINYNPVEQNALLTFNGTNYFVFLKSYSYRLNLYYYQNNTLDFYDLGTYYISVNLEFGTLQTTNEYSTDYYHVYLYEVKDGSIDIYDNSQDAWASVVSVVTDATDSIINNDLLLLFAAAVPVISFGVGFLIRLKYRG